MDLRNQNWQTKEADKGPKTIAEIREEVCSSLVFILGFYHC